MANTDGTSKWKLVQKVQASEIPVAEQAQAHTHTHIRIHIRIWMAC